MVDNAYYLKIKIPFLNLELNSRPIISAREAPGAARYFQTYSNPIIEISERKGKCARKISIEHLEKII